MKNMLMLVVLLLSATVWAAEYHVSVNGKESGDGSAGNPFRRIQAAADIAQPGDVITVHEGLYRERIDPPRGGTSDSQRIIYRAAPGEKVEIKGSEVITGWEKVQNDTWKVTVPNSLFGDYNPYSYELRGAWYLPLKKGGEQSFRYHSGAVYLNGTWLEEAKNLSKVLDPVGSDARFYAKVDNSNTTIWAQLKGYDPDEDTIEINVRKLIFYPDRRGCNYITVRGFIIRQAATPWCDGMTDMLAMVGTNWSKGWIIENNVISHAICGGISMGQGEVIDPETGKPVPGGEWTDFLKVIDITVTNGWARENIGCHVIRNNDISHCEQIGIYGLLGSVYSTIEGNSIHDIAVRRWLKGWDICGMMLCGGVGTQVKDNHWYRCQGLGAIWMDWMCQDARVTGNLMHDNYRDFFMEALHGPHLVDNNILLSSQTLRDFAGGGAFVNNIFGGNTTHHRQKKRSTPFFKPQTLEIAGIAQWVGDDERFINNLFIGNEGLSEVYIDDDETNLQVEGNVYLSDARPDKREKDAVVVPGYDPNVKLEKKGDEWWLSYAVDLDAISKVKRKIVTTETLTKAIVPNLPFREIDGEPYRIDSDYFGRSRNTDNPAPGPFEASAGGTVNVKVWPK